MINIPMGYDYDFFSYPERSDSMSVKPKMEGRLKFVKYSNCRTYYLILQPDTREEKWVSASSLQSDGALVAFYDADSTYLPSSERRGDV